MSGFLLPIFPESSLAASVTTTVWVGVWVVALFNLRLGWTLSGLVVPGYMVPLLLIKPVSASVILGEAVLTYAIVGLISEYRHVKPWTSFFGRDRFLAIVLMSILVRCVMDGWILPVIGDALTFHYGWQLSFRDNLHSFGLIIVSLIANYFWKPGLKRGLIPLCVTIGVTYLIVRFGLVRWTNFSLGNLQYMYEEIATSLLASPKAYIVMITTAYLASQMNLKYGWEFNGILIPGLLALEWTEPLKIVSTFTEAFVVLAIASLLLKLPLFQRITMEGARKTLLFFNIAFALRLTLGHLVPLWFPEIKVTDLFGFGYLLSTLIATRLHSQGVWLRVPAVSLQVSLVGVVAGTLIGFVMTQTIDVATADSSEALVVKSGTPISERQSLTDIVRAEKVRLYRHQSERLADAPQPRQLAAFSNAMTELLGYCRDRHDLQLAAANSEFKRAHFELITVEDRYAVIRESEPYHGWGTYVIDTERPAGLAVEVPAPTEEWATFETGLLLFHELNAGSLAIGDIAVALSTVGHKDSRSRDVTETIYGAFHHAMAKANVLEVRSDLSKTLHQQHRPWTPGTGQTEHTEFSRLWVKRGLPKSLNLLLLEELLGDFRIEWQTTPRCDELRDSVWTGHGELNLTERECRRMLAELWQRHKATSDVQTESLAKTETSLAAWLRKQTDEVPGRATNTYQPPLAEQLFFFDEEVLRPLLPLLFIDRPTESWTADERDQLIGAAAAANVLGYSLELLEDRHADSEFVALTENTPREQRRGWGSYLFRLGSAHPTAIEIPRLLRGQWTCEYGLSLFRDLQARTLLLAGVHPNASTELLLDLDVDTNPLTLFNLVRQVLIREVDPQPWRHIQVRAFSTPIDVDVVVAQADPAALESGAFDDVLLRLKADGLRVRETNGSEETAGFECDNQLLLKSLRLGRQVQAATLWLAPNLRTQFRTHVDDALQAAEFQAVQIPTVMASIEEHLTALANETELQPYDGPFQTIVSSYLISRNVIELRRLQQLWSEAVWTRVVDVESEQSYLIGQSDGQLLVVYLAELAYDGSRPMPCQHLNSSTIHDFVDSRATWLERSADP